MVRKKNQIYALKFKMIFTCHGQVYLKKLSYMYWHDGHIDHIKFLFWSLLSMLDECSQHSFSKSGNQVMWTHALSH